MSGDHAPATYCIDTSALIDLRDDYPRDVLPAVWGRVETLIEESRLHAPEEVRREVMARDDDLAAWADQQTAVFAPDTLQLVEIVKGLLTRHRDIWGRRKYRYEADPWVVGLALAQSDQLLYRVVVVTHEEPGGGRKIPDICTAEGIKCVRLPEMFKSEGWRFGEQASSVPT